MKGVVVPKHLMRLLREHQGGAKERARALRENMKEEALRRISVLTQEHSFLLLTALYWGEGTKKDFAIINSDPRLIQTFISCLDSLGIEKRRISIALRVHSNISIKKAKNFWSKTTKTPIEDIGKVEVVVGRKEGKLEHGMCRVRVRNGIRERILIQSAIEVIGKLCSQKVLSK